MSGSRTEPILIVTAQRRGFQATRENAAVLSSSASPGLKGIRRTRPEGVLHRNGCTATEVRKHVRSGVKGCPPHPPPATSNPCPQYPQVLPSGRGKRASHQ